MCPFNFFVTHSNWQCKGGWQIRNVAAAQQCVVYTNRICSIYLSAMIIRTVRPQPQAQRSGTQCGIASFDNPRAMCNWRLNLIKMRIHYSAYYTFGYIIGILRRSTSRTTTTPMLVEILHKRVIHIWLYMRLPPSLFLCSTSLPIPRKKITSGYLCLRK